MTTKHPHPTASAIRHARELFARYERRNNVYLRVQPQVTEGLHLGSDLGDVLAATACEDLLMAWNWDYLRFHPTKVRTLGADLVTLIRSHRHNLQTYQRRRLERLSTKDRQRVERLFTAFEDVLGRTGAAKVLHLLAPEFFPLWDANIRRAYGMEPRPVRFQTYAHAYSSFMEITCEQRESLPPEMAAAPDVLKAIDEYNYVTCTKPWWAARFPGPGA